MELENGIQRSLEMGIVAGMENAFQVEFKRCMPECGHFLFEFHLNRESQLSDDELRTLAFEEITRALMTDGWDITQDWINRKSEKFQQACPGADTLFVGGETDRVEIHFQLDKDDGRAELNVWREL